MTYTLTDLHAMSNHKLRKVIAEMKGFIISRTSGDGLFTTIDSYEHWVTKVGYVDLIKNTMMKYPCLYTLDSLREKMHNEICTFYGLPKKLTKEITDNLDKYQDAVDVHLALQKLQKREES